MVKIQFNIEDYNGSDLGNFIIEAEKFIDTKTIECNEFNVADEEQIHSLQIIRIQSENKDLTIKRWNE